MVSYFTESGRSIGLRKAVAVYLFEDLAKKLPRSARLAVRLEGELLRVAVALWWPWLLTLGAGHLAAWWLARGRVAWALRTFQVPLVTSVRVRTTRKRPTRRNA